jgi:hypothetical protein
MDNDRETREELGELLKGTLHRESIVARIEHGIALGLILRQQANDLRFDGLDFYVVLGMSIIKDLSDAMTLSLLSWLTVLPITFGLQIFFLMRKSFLKRFIINNFLWKFIPLTILEALPGTSFFPSYILATIFLKRRIDKEIRKIKSEVEDVDKEVDNIKVPRDE